MNCSSVVANYYQPLGPLDSDLEKTAFTHYCLAAVHFGTDAEGKPYMHLNDHVIDDPVFEKPMAQLQQLHAQGKTIRLMVGGAGSAFQQLFSDYSVYYGLLRNALKARPWITGIDLDVEEQVLQTQIEQLILNIDADFGPDFIVTMAPIAPSLASNSPGMGGFVYRDLLQTKAGQRIDWFNGQFYGGSWSADTVDAIVENGVPASKVVMGMLFSDFPTLKSLSQAALQLAAANRRHPTLRGAFVWEHDLAKPSPNGWAAIVSSALNGAHAIPAPSVPAPPSPAPSGPEKVKEAILNHAGKAKNPVEDGKADVETSEQTVNRVCVMF